MNRPSLSIILIDSPKFMLPTGFAATFQIYRERWSIHYGSARRILALNRANQRFGRARAQVRDMWRNSADSFFTVCWRLARLLTACSGELGYLARKHIDLNSQWLNSVCRMPCVQITRIRAALSLNARARKCLNRKRFSKMSY